jgi:hypothetical protein
MMPYAAAPLQTHEIGRAFPLVQLMMPMVDFRRWERFARSFLRNSARRGILAARDHRGHIRGLAIFRRQLDIGGQILLADPVLFVDLLDSTEVGLTLVAALEAKARDMGCTEIRVNMSDHQARAWPTPPGAARIEMRRLTTSLSPIDQIAREWRRNPSDRSR